MAKKIEIIKGILKRSNRYSIEYLLTWSLKDLINYRKHLIFINKHKKEED